MDMGSPLNLRNEGQVVILPSPYHRHIPLLPPHSPDCHPGLEPGSIPQSHMRLNNGPRLKAGVTGGACTLVTDQSAPSTLARRVPPHAYFVVSAVFHYLGPSFAVLLFAAIEPLGVAWLRIVTAAAVFALWRRPWRIAATMSWPQRRGLIGFGLTLAGVNALF